ncbi:MAG TPA: ABC transporter substrate-binding protein [Chloroflexota bacterium]|nr:ABC transporter substrate-binding protein [Chloroflexota bacterium]
MVEQSPGTPYRRLALGLALGLLVAACSRAPAPTPPAAAAGPAPAAPAAAPPASPPATLLPVRAAFTSFSASAAPWWMAQEGGYFREQGLAVDLVQVAAGATLLAALQNGDLEVVFSGGPSLVLGYLQGLETMIVGSTSNGLDISIFVRPDLQTVDDVRGKTIGAGRPKSITDIATRLAFERVGLQPDKDFYVGVTGGLPESLAALETGTIDGAALNVPMVFEAQRQGYRELLSLADMPIPFTTSAVGATKKTIAARPEIFEPFLRALAQGVSRLKTDREAAIDVLSKYNQSDDRDLLGATVDHNRPLWVTDPYPDPAGVQTVIDVEDAPGARDLRPEEVIDARFAERLRQSGFLDGLAR